jgi:hypothetical protein
MIYLHSIYFGAWLVPEEPYRVIGSPASRRLDHPDRALAHAAVRTWFERRYGERRGRQTTVATLAASARQGGGDIEVRAHERDGRKVHVRSIRARHLPEDIRV